MHLALSLLKQFINIQATPEQIAEKLTLSGSEVEKITTQDAGISKVVVGEIKEIKTHPNADKLRLAYVDIGKAKLLEIVCGAPNIEVGQKVPCVLVGGSVPGLKIEAREVRGVKSHGMLAGYDELIPSSDDHEGIYILPNSANVGEDVIKLLELDEPVLELDITPNRPDCFSVRGLAREVAALYKVKVKSDKVPARNATHSVAGGKVKEISKQASTAVSVRVKDAKLCSQYSARVIENVNIQPSPLWLSNKLRQLGVRSINNVVDVTNYVMMELGQPLHAFDFDTLEPTSTRPSPKKQIIIRNAKKGEKIATLDDKTYTLKEDMLIIADAKKPLAIAGIMGGKHSGVSETTSTIILESALFNSVSIRKTAKALGLRSESSSRFEKGVDAEAVEEALDRAAGLIAELSGGGVLRGVISVKSPQHKVSRTLKINVQDITRLLGVEISVGKITSILKSLGFKTEPSSRSSSAAADRGGDKKRPQLLSITVPSWRMHDVQNSADIAEEIGRMLNYNTLPKTLPIAQLNPPLFDPLYTFRRGVRSYLVGAGYTELLSYSFYGKKHIAYSSHTEKEHIVVTNPVNDEYPYMRTSLAPWMLERLSQNSSRSSSVVFRFFEMGKIFEKKQGESWGLVCGLVDMSATDEQLFRQLRGVVEGIAGVELSVSQTDASYILSHHKITIGRITIYPKNTLALRFRSSTALLEIDIEALSSIARPKKTYTPIPYYPAIERDIALLIPAGVQYKDAQTEIQRASALIKKVALFDVYHGLREGSSYAIRLTCYSTDRTLESREVDDLVETVSKSLVKKYNILVR